MIEDGKTGFLVEVGDTYEVGKQLKRLVVDKKHYKRCSTRCEQGVKGDYFTIANAIRWLYLALQLSTRKTFSPNGRSVDTLIKKDSKKI